MARFDVHPMPQGGRGYLLDVQADLLDQLDTRVVVPLLSEDQAPPPLKGLNPIFEIEGMRHVMVTQFIATLRTKELGEALLSLDEHHYTITNALDLLLTGY
jgi:toxin CcdB